MNKDFFAFYGIDYDNGLNNCMGDTSFYKAMLSSFTEDACYSNAKNALQSKDYEALFDCFHELKGVCGNLGLSELYNVVAETVELLRGGKYEEAKITRLFAAFEKAYFNACEGIEYIINA